MRPHTHAWTKKRGGGARERHSHTHTHAQAFFAEKFGENVTTINVRFLHRLSADFALDSLAVRGFSHFDFCKNFSCKCNMQKSQIFCQKKTAWNACVTRAMWPGRCKKLIDVIDVFKASVISMLGKFISLFYWHLRCCYLPLLLTRLLTFKHKNTEKRFRGKETISYSLKMQFSYPSSSPLAGFFVAKKHYTH